MARSTRKQVEVAKISGDIVWGAACAAQRLNGEYVKLPEFNQETNKTTRPNKEIMREIMFNPSLITDQDREQANLVRTYWRNKLVEVLSNTANQFTQQAVQLAGKEEFLANEYFALGTVAFLPEGCSRGIRRDEQRMKKSDAVMGSSHFGKIGEKISGKATIIESRYSEKWGTHYTTAQFGNNVILFAFRERLGDNTQVMFTGTVKAHRDEGITQLNRVRVMK